VNTSQILNDQVIYVKRGRMNGLGFEPCWNAYFDFYLETKYFGKPLLELQDLGLHLYLRKNLNDQNPQWKMPTIRQLKKKFDISFDKLDAILHRLDAAHLLRKESGVRKDNGMNARNHYILSDPIPTFDEFLMVAGEGLFGIPLKPEWIAPNMSSQLNTSSQPEFKDRLETNQTPCPGNRDTSGSEIGTLRVPEIGTNQQTLKTKQTLGEQTVNPLWEKVLADFKMQLPPKTFQTFLEGTDLAVIEEGIAVISITTGYAKDWIENRLANKIKYALQVEGIRCVVLTEA
jgi:DnaA N-terminal domain